ncbi:hypothetical protein M8998_14085 [Sphingobacterium sp. lm-10]|uniref:hypothetical protein n=1 Tax=Sphingobacterium sp. lm-10 TaxID=2944904 RepID=UPI002020A574|nr:hypothetical protein [Sphingobacterium sp. lm-10]MCL7989074.1 hypothetical protein [Sphingobacterium sp. lm-10]
MQSFYRGIMALDYQIHLPDYLAKCINIEKPQLQCNGQCALMKQIRDREQQEAKSNLANYEFSALYLHKEQILLPSYPVMEIKVSNPVPRFIPQLTPQEGNSVFRPPIV